MTRTIVDFQSALRLDLFECVAATVVVVWLLFRRNAITAGLPLCYLLSLGMIHVVGAWIHSLPWMQVGWSGVVSLGFNQCVHGIVAFTVALGAFEFVRFRRSRRTELRPQTAASLWGRPAVFYVLLGISVQVVFTVALRAVPSIGAVANTGSYLIVAAMCLACVQAWQRGHRWRMLVWTGSVIVLPFYTMITMGFLGYGAAAASVVLVFAMVLYRPRWQAFLVFCLSTYLGLSLFVTYMRDRIDIREAVWGGEEYSVRSATLHETFSNFEFFDLHDERHLEHIDTRLNQNYLVGAAAVNILSGDVPRANGGTIIDSLLALVPRIIWPGKPVRAGSPEIVSQYTGITFAEGTSVGVGQVMEFFINFGSWGVWIGFFLLGLVLRLADYKAGLALMRRDEMAFFVWFVPAMALLQTGGSFVEVTSTAAASLAFVLSLRFAFPHQTARDVATPLAANTTAHRA